MSDKRQKQLWKLIQKGDLGKVTDFLNGLPIAEAYLLLSKPHKASGDSPVHLACRHGFLSIARYLRETWNIGLELRNLDDKTPLHEASACGHLDVATYLLDEGTAVDSLKRSDWTPLMLACTKGANLPVVTLLLDRGANMCLVNKDGWNCFHIACREGDADTVRYLLASQPEIWRTVSHNGRTPLHTAAMHGQEAVLNILLDRCDFSLDVHDSCGSTPLMEAVKGGHVRLAKTLVNLGADANAADNLGRSALHVAAECDRADAVQFLVSDCGVDPNSRTKPCGLTKSGHTALDWARKERQTNAVAMLKALGAVDAEEELLPDSTLRKLSS